MPRRRAAEKCLAAMSFAFFVSGCGGGAARSARGAVGPRAKEENPKSLYFRLGGERTIAALVDELIPRAALDPRVNFFRKGTAREWQPTPENVAHLKKMFVEYLGAVTGGPLKYDGKDLKTAHAGMNINASEFDALVADFRAALDKLGVAGKEREEFLALVLSARGEVEG